MASVLCASIAKFIILFSFLAGKEKWSYEDTAMLSF
jgi:hypothetical protein